MFDLLKVLCFILAGVAVLFWAYLIANLIEALFSPQHRQDMFEREDRTALGIITGISLLVGIPSLVVLFLH